MLSLHSKEANSLNRFVDMCTQLFPGKQYNEDILTWYWDYSYRVVDLAEVDLTIPPQIEGIQNDNEKCN